VKVGAPVDEWWGVDSIAHNYPRLKGPRGTRGRYVAACGHDATGLGGSMGRLDPETCKPWPRCEKCAALTRSDAR